MRKVLSWLLHLALRLALFLRYRISVEGLEQLKTHRFPKKGGILFLANHPAEIDPSILTLLLWKRYRPHPVAIDYLFHKPIVRTLLNFVGGLPIPNFEDSSNSFKRKQIDDTFLELYSLLNRGENLLIYPAGGLKKEGHEVIGGASGVHKILQEVPDANVVLVRTSGLWGSSFSRALIGRTPDLGEVFKHGIKVLLKNLVFFSPRRKISVECIPAPDDFPWNAPKLDLNRYLERWYNKDGPEPLSLVSYSLWKEELPKIQEKPKVEEISLDEVPQEIKTRVIEELARLSGIGASRISPADSLATELGLDSLDQAQILVFLKDQFGVNSLHASELETVGCVIAFAARLKKSKYGEEEEQSGLTAWHEEKKRPLAMPPQGETLLEAFFHSCRRMDGFLACVDAVSGEVSYRKFMLGVQLLSRKIAKLPGERIGVMMPASVGVNVTILAILMAGKTPVMINWTLGSRNLRSVAEQSGVQRVISSWNFLNRLENVELDGIDDKIVLIEEIRHTIGWFDKIGALLFPKKRPPKKLNPDDPAVILFTSGTESFPKGVPLSHRNILSNLKDAYSYGQFQSSDILLGVLPPFHSFGFSVTGLFPLLAGMRVVFSPNPTDGRRMASAIEQWHVTIACMAPTFLKNLLRVASQKQLKTLRLVVSGAERTPQEIYEKMRELNGKAEVLEGYGITECAPILTLNPVGKEKKGVGIPLPRVELLIVGPETRQKLAVGQEGLILARGPNVFAGYLDSSLASPFFEVDGKLWYETGDLGSLDERGYLTLAGRLKRFVKIGGEMVSLNAIEKALLDGAPHQGWKLDEEKPSLAVCAIEPEGKKSEIHLFTIFETTPEQVNEELRASGMSNLIRISSVHNLPFIPLLGTGKIDYRALKERMMKS